jgi:hypothetical protein
MTQCNECGGETNNLKTLQAGQMQVLCEDCKEDLINGYESDTDKAQDDTSKDGQTHADGGTETADPSISDEWTVQSIREEWNTLNVRLPDYLMRRFNSYHKRLDWELSKQGSTREFQKDRHYKPLVIALGLREIEDIEAEELTELLIELERNQIVE